MSVKERYQNPVVGDTVTLRMFTYNSNARTDFQSVDKVDVFYLDPNAVTEANPQGRTLITTIAGQDIQHASTGLYQVALALPDPTYVIGQYIDVWTVRADQNEEASEVTNDFKIYPDLWYTSPIPIVYDFSFVFRPNKIRQGSKKWLIIEVTPNVPQASDLARYYEQLATVSPLSISISAACGDCLPPEADLRLVVENEPVQLREKGVGYYFLDTTTMQPGIYDVWFTLPFGESLHISDTQQLQIF
jgi:hypothetical protein